VTCKVSENHMNNRFRGHRTCLVIVLLSASTLLAGKAEPEKNEADPRVEHFELHIRPVLMNTCVECHGRQKAEHDLRVDRRVTIVNGGKSGPAIVPGKPDKSLLIQALRHEHPDIQMPPDERLDARVVDAFEKWVREGAVWPERSNIREDSIDLDKAKKYWAFRPVREPKTPDVKGASTPIDAFIEARLRDAKLKPLERADKRTLLRRATFDLTGLPPTQEQIDAFLSDRSPDAFAKVVDRLLASREYGRRWGRHWLDVARYADTCGDGCDRPVPEARLYRDYVIDAFNNDMPYDQFIREQIAGDILAERDSERYAEKVIATGYVALTRRFGNSKFADFELVVDNTIDTIGRGLLGMTLACARCHDHKFDAVTLEDYYGLYGYFKSTQYPHPGTEAARDRSDFVPLDPELARRFKEIDSVLGAKRHKLEKMKKAARKGELSADNKKQIPSLETEVAELQKQLPEVPIAYAVTDNREEVGDAKVHMAGNPDTLGEAVPRGFLRVITPDPANVDPKRSGRLELANWIVADDNPLTPRVIVNRIWHWHFGRGIVETTDNFGTQGKAPTHPKLLDYLAAQFVDSGWSIKRMHRMIMLTDAYQRTSRPESQHLQTDPRNTLLWRFNRQRLEAEAIRDSVLFVAGRLDFADGGDHPFPPLEKHKQFTQHRPFFDVYEHNKRSVYLMTPRLTKHPFLAMFDGPNPNRTTGVRDESTVPLQSLFMMNSAFVRENATAFGKRMLESGDDDAARLRFGYEAAFARQPSESELAEMIAYMDHLRERLTAAKRSKQEAARDAYTSVARVLMSSNEFLHID